MRELIALLAVVGIIGIAMGAAWLTMPPAPQSSDKSFMERVLPAGPPEPPSWLRSR